MFQNLQNELRPHLDINEHLLWTGKPKTGIVLNTSDIFLIPFSIFWCGFAIFWVIGASQAGFLFALFGVPFVAVGLMMVFGRFIIDAKQRENTTYGLTQNRIIIKSGIFNSNIQSIDLKTLTNINLKEKKDGNGTIYLGPQQYSRMAPWGDGMNWWPGAQTTPKLTQIQDARQVYRKVIDQKELAQKA